MNSSLKKRCISYWIMALEYFTQSIKNSRRLPLSFLTFTISHPEVIKSENLWLLGYKFKYVSENVIRNYDTWKLVKNFMDQWKSINKFLPSRVIRHWWSERHRSSVGFPVVDSDTGPTSYVQPERRRSYVGFSVPDCRHKNGVDSVAEWSRQPGTELQTWNRCRFSSGMISATQYWIADLKPLLNRQWIPIFMEYV